MRIGCCFLNKRKRRLHYLVGDLEGYEDNVRCLFEISKYCSLQEDKGQMTLPHEDQLFIFLENAPFFGRQTYQMWRSMFDLPLPPFKKFDFSRPKAMHLLSLETFHIKDAKVNGIPFVEFIGSFLKTFFSGLNIHLVEQFSAEDFNPIHRKHPVTGKRQLLVSDFYGKMHEVTKLPKSDYILGLTWTDLYPKEELNFVLGEASYHHKCGVFSFGRFEPQTFEGQATSDNEDDTDLELDGEIVWKMLRVATHETCHLFGLQHCVFFHCAMNGSSSISEAITQPLFLCPVCLRKLQKFLGFDVLERYQDLLKMCGLLQVEYPSQSMSDAIHWLKECLQFLNSRKF
ncbi:Archaemetzincin-2 [Holothuria leucospilota]|uniref:Archaemetzincin-2 n=1 Tax=Holothuria leucospilota TaxID=206669 RepID=A0A9Q1BG85_HOLLE|nr:Archaemetzincin-2 [Holothuria leucospilota]